MYLRSSLFGIAACPRRLPKFLFPQASSFLSWRDRSSYLVLVRIFDIKANTDRIAIYALCNALLNICHIIIVHVDYPLYRAREAKHSILFLRWNRNGQLTRRHITSAR
jgi:hypothetical protein